MLRSLFSGISGLRAHQQMMDVTGNNIANVNTAGFKSSQAVFQDTLNQMLKSPAAPQDEVQGGTNPAQVGLGVQLAGISTNFTQGSAQTTGRSTDLMITGDGFFTVKNNEETLYTRSGSFSFDADGSLVTADGARVQGWVADPETGEIPSNTTPTNLSLPISTLLAPSQTTEVTFAGNLPSDAEEGTVVTPSLTVYDGSGNATELTVTLTKTAATNVWNLNVGDGTNAPEVTGTITFDDDGTNPVTDPSPLTFAATAGDIDVDLAGLTNYAGTTTVAPQNQDGYAMGSLQGFSITKDGQLVGSFTNGLRKPLGQIALASFNNAAGLEKAGGSMFRGTVNSGVAQLGTPGGGSRGSIMGGTLEMSNVDLASEFTNLIIAQRGFQANSKVISTSDELLNDLVNLKR
ncbi:flagellar hook protein FlgE [Cryptosporangium aurantiacum]|uniref:Flagellar hook protein FlgE n=1 Tax=Cryptosporangium aurantiacum TaxID=134849 RepID=A0A1M7R791_9ACTN|nr:flagellar hook protein FlgE [Cryptosporangium aurantiacum]SHN42040.1 flagellar hook protein FlgE [Cryptosporangium aurantiacum]